MSHQRFAMVFKGEMNSKYHVFVKKNTTQVNMSHVQKIMTSVVFTIFILLYFLIYVAMCLFDVVVALHV
jgi:uncharacterized membrane protein